MSEIQEEMVKHCGNECCRGTSCANWSKCKGETIPPWNCSPSPSTAQVCIRDQDVFAAADELAAVLTEYVDHTAEGVTVIDCGYHEIELALNKYKKVREGKRSE